MDISEITKEEARMVGLCDEWYNAWGNASQEEMLDKFVKGQDFCIKHNFPPLDIAESRFDKGARHSKGVYINEQFEDLNKPYFVIMGEAQGKITATQHTVSTIYVRHKAKVRVKAKHHSIVWVRAYNDSEVDIECDSTSKVFVYPRDNSKTDAYGRGKIAIRERKFNCY